MKGLSFCSEKVLKEKKKYKSKKNVLYIKPKNTLKCFQPMYYLPNHP